MNYFKRQRSLYLTMRRKEKTAVKLSTRKAFEKVGYCGGRTFGMYHNTFLALIITIKILTD